MSLEVQERAPRRRLVMLRRCDGRWRAKVYAVFGFGDVWLAAKIDGSFGFVWTHAREFFKKPVAEPEPATPKARRVRRRRKPGVLVRLDDYRRAPVQSLSAETVL